MDVQQNAKRQEIVFSGSKRIPMLEVIQDIDAGQIQQTLNIQQPKALIMISGGAAKIRLNKREQVRLSNLFSLGIARAAASLDAAIMDGGTAVGVMKMMGQGVADRDHNMVLLGVAPASKVTYPGGPAEGSIEGGAALDCNHSHFVLVKGEAWGDETETMYRLAKTISAGIPVMTILADGGLNCKKEALQAVRYGWPIIVIEGSGGEADKLALLWRRKASFLGKRLRSSIVDPVEAEIIANGKVRLFPMMGSPEALEKLIFRQCQESQYQLNTDQALKRAWELFARYDENAKKQHKRYKQEQAWIVWLGILIITLVASQIQGLPRLLPWIAQPLHYTIVFVPILISILLSIASRFNAGNKWVMLRGNAEAIKSEIYRYRSQADAYNDKETKETPRQAKLTHVINTINDQLLDTDVMNIALPPYSGLMPPEIDCTPGIDDGLCLLSPERYIAFRLDDQLNFFHQRTRVLERRARRMRWLMYIAGGAGTLLAAAGFELWVTLTTTIFTSCVTYLEYEQTEMTLRKYNIVATLLENVKNWWISLTPEEKEQQHNKDRLVVTTESALREEGSGWMSLLQDAVSRASDADRLGKVVT